MKHILAISGSTRANSSNLLLIQIVAELAKDLFTTSVYHQIADIPHFNPDLDNESPPKAVINFRNQLNNADGILICTPEYAMGVPGTLKNASDWTVSSCEFSHKPTALITASSLGEKGHASLLETLKIIEADIPDSTQLVISHIKMKINALHGIIHAETKSEILQLIAAFHAVMNKTETA